MICPKCGRKIERLLGVSRVGNKTVICNDCGTMEALDRVPHGVLWRQKRTMIAVMVTGDEWAMETFYATHNLELGG